MSGCVVNTHPTLRVQLWGQRCKSLDERSVLSDHRDARRWAHFPGKKKVTTILLGKMMSTGLQNSTFVLPLSVLCAGEEGGARGVFSLTVESTVL